MKPINFFTSACRYCRHYQPEGRRGGTCQQLGASVQASWKACSLALPPFAPSWEKLEDSWSLPDATPVLETSHSLAAVADNINVVPVEEIVSLTPEEAEAKALLI
ncbi:hypothetical protein H6G76_27010 [Nostoc sp. FACHB-152]|uniref:hypothetical protein n=1 Tax=unclassified Nostoc TaxID=2593658 RepID=UPI0016898D47|nr:MULTISPECIES: hypothetical protein [unclassified Nostoc]MBD2450714.1 hypothetical protein [Nostoc sp. FACHB-152]MBD2471926.1 hypothetical protein [Nostoc sp. FACHB-145]